MLEADFEDITTKSEALGERFIAEVEARCAGTELTLVSPRDPTARGSHVSFSHPHAYELCRALIDRGVVGDFRASEVIRFGLTPLYTSFADVWQAAECLADVLATRAWDRDDYRQRIQVT